MDIDKSIQSAQINYMNCPSPQVRSSNESSNIPRKNKKMFNLETSEVDMTQAEEEYLQECQQEIGEIVIDEDHSFELNYINKDCSGIPYIKYYVADGKFLKFLIDNGANKNFIAPKLANKAQQVQEPFIIHSAGGDIMIKQKVIGKFFEHLGNYADTEFFVLPSLTSFDGIIGDDTLRELEAVIDRNNNTTSFSPNIQLELYTKRSLQVHNLEINESIRELITKYQYLFEPVSDENCRKSRNQNDY